MLSCWQHRDRLHSARQTCRSHEAQHVSHAVMPDLIAEMWEELKVHRKYR